MGAMAREPQAADIDRACGWAGKAAIDIGDSGTSASWKE